MKKFIEAARERAKAVTSMTDEYFDRFTGKNGLIIVEGDSWFSYPLFPDICEILQRRFDYTVDSRAAHHGHTLEDMAYSEYQLYKLAWILAEHARKKQTPKAVLLSAGGNDIVGKQFGFLLNHDNSGREKLNAAVVKGLLDERLRPAAVELITSVTELCVHYFGRIVPIVIHGYDIPFPDGRGFPLSWHGPWMRPGFIEKGYKVATKRDLIRNRQIIRELILEYNKMLEDLQQLDDSLGHVHYLSLLGTLKSENYFDDWNDELHPTEKGFIAIAKKFDGLIRTF